MENEPPPGGRPLSKKNNLDETDQADESNEDLQIENLDSVSFFRIKNSRELS